MGTLEFLLVLTVVFLIADFMERSFKNRELIQNGIGCDSLGTFMGSNNSVLGTDVTQTSCPSPAQSPVAPALVPLQAQCGSSLPAGYATDGPEAAQ